MAGEVLRVAGSSRPSPDPVTGAAPSAGGTIRRANPEWLAALLPGHWALAVGGYCAGSSFEGWSCYLIVPLKNKP